MKLMIVDDEWFVRDRIIQSIHWDSHHIESVLSANDGFTGYQTALENHPDIVLTDVRMPQMDGIELCSRLRKEMPACTLIMMSAYSDIEYLKSAIEVSALRYIDKPVKMEQLEKVLDDAVQFQMTQKHNKLKEKSMSQMLDTCLPITKAEILRKLLSREECENQDLLTLFGRIFPDLPVSGKYVTALAGFRPGIGQNIPSIGILEQFLNQHLLESDPCILYRPDISDTIVIILNQNNTNKISDWFLSLQRQWNNADCSLRFIAGQTVNGISHIGESYLDALAALNRSFYHPYQEICFGMRNEAKEPPDLDSLFLLPLLKHLQNGITESLVSFIDELGCELRMHDDTPIETVRLLLERVFSLIVTNARQNGLQLPDLRETAVVIQHAAVLDDILDVLKVFVRRIFDSVKARPVSAFIVDDICSFIEQNCTDPSLSLNALSSRFHISPAYLCVLFKRERAATINQYLIRCRMQYARKLLMNPLSLIKDVSTAVGYNDCNYFIRCFKKEFGCTPNKFKEEYLNVHKITTKITQALP